MDTESRGFDGGANRPRDSAPNTESGERCTARELDQNAESWQVAVTLEHPWTRSPGGITVLHRSTPRLGVRGARTVENTGSPLDPGSGGNAVTSQGL